MGLVDRLRLEALLHEGRVPTHNIDTGEPVELVLSEALRQSALAVNPNEHAALLREAADTIEDLEREIDSYKNADEEVGP